MLVDSLRDEATMHRLWYDLRSQSLFEESFRADVAAIDKSLENMIWRIVSRYADLAGRTITIAPATMYAVFDGLFQQSLARHLSGDDTAADSLADNVDQVLALVIPAR